MILILLGISAGGLTTISGFGGGLLLVVVLALVWDPLAALTVSSMVLLVGNGHRLLLFRDHVSWRLAALFLVGAVPGSTLAGVLAVSIPADVLSGLILGMTALALARAVTRVSWRFPSRALIPSGAIIGAIGAAAGGVGALLGPLMLTAGLSGNRYIATMSTIAVGMHVGRLTGYSAGGQMSTTLLGAAALLAIGLMIGNWLGKAARDRLAARHLTLVEYAAPVACAALAAAGLAQ